MELVSVDTRFELAKSAIENGEISIAENLLASLLGFSPDHKLDFTASTAQLSGNRAEYVDAWQRLIDARNQTMVSDGRGTRGIEAEANSSPAVAPKDAKVADFNRIELSVSDSSSRYDPNQIFDPRNKCLHV